MTGVLADRVVVELEAKLGRYNANVLAAQRGFEKGMSGMRSSATRTEGVVTASFRRMASVAATTLSVGALIAGAKGFLAYVDAAKQLTAQLKLATKETGDFATAQRDVREIAASTRTDINATGALYAKIARSAHDLGIQQETVARVTKTVAETFLISGSSAVEAAQGTRQLIQGFQSGVLRGDEFNSVMELAPRLARLLAESLGVPIGQLRAMAEAGDLTSDKLVKAFSDKKFTAALDEEFKQLPVTFEQAMTLVSNAAQQTFSAFDQGGQFSNALINFITSGDDGFGDLATAAEQMGIDIASTLSGLATAFDPMLDGAARVFGSIRSQADGLALAIADVLGAADKANNFGVGIRNAGRRVDNFFGENRPLLQGSNLRGNFLQGYQKRKNTLTLDSRERAVQRLPGTGNSFQRFLNEPGKYDAFGNAIHPDPAVVIPGKAKKAKKAKGPSAETLAARAERARLQQEREDEAYRQDLAKLNEDIIAAKASLVVAAEAVAAAEIGQLESERDRTNASYAAEVVQKKLTATQAAELTEANNRLASFKIQAVQLREQERIRAEAVEVAQGDHQNELDMAQAVSNLADTRKEQRDAALRILDLQFDIERAELENVIASRESTAAQKEIARRRLAMLGQLQAAEKAGVEKQNRGPMANYLAGFNAQDINDQLEQVQVDGLKGIEDQLTTTIAKVFELGGAFGKVANQIIADLIRIAVQKAILGIVGAATGGGGIFGSLFGGGGGPTTATAGPGGTLRASGGHVVRGKLYRVNEGGGAEGFQPAGSGKIIPLGRMNGAGGGGNVTVYAPTTLDARYGITTPELLRHVNQVATTRAMQAGKASFDAAQKSLPRRFGEFTKLGT